MFDSKEKKSTQYLSGMIARMPTVDPPCDLTEGVMQRVRPKKVKDRQRWMRRINTYVAMLTRPASGWAAAAALLVVGIVVFNIYYQGPRELLPNGDIISEAGKTQVIFVLDQPSAHKVAVIGSFNQWNPDGFLMHRESTGAPWMITLQLERGKHTYAFLIDDHTIVPDPHSLWQQDDGFGNLNSSIIVENGKQNDTHI